MAKFHIFNRNIALLMTVFVAAQAAIETPVEINEDEYVDKTVKDNAPGLVSHMIGGGGMNLQKLAVQTEMTPLKMNEYEPETVRTQADDAEQTVDETAADLAVDAQSAGQNGQEQFYRETDQIVQQPQYANDDNEETSNVQ